MSGPGCHGSSFPDLSGRFGSGHVLQGGPAGVFPDTCLMDPTGERVSLLLAFSP